MARKYENHVLTNVPEQQGPFGKAIAFAGVPAFGPGADFSISMLCVKEAQSHAAEGIHMHDDADRYFIFMSMNPDDLSDLGATVEFSLGPEGNQEKFVIDKTTTFYVPKGFYHTPLEMKRVDRPFLFIYAVMTGTMPSPPDDPPTSPK